VFSQRGHFRLVRYHLVQTGPAFERPMDMTIDAQTGQVTVRYKDEHGEDKTEVVNSVMTIPLAMSAGSSSRS
jgi:hypothetical protein